MNIREFIPKHKDDHLAIEALRNLSFEEIKPIIPDLLEWLQDINWPIAGPIADILKPFSDQLVPDIIKILQTNDGIWKLWILKTLVRNNKDETLLNELKRISMSPTKDEIEGEVDIEASEILNELG